METYNHTCSQNISGVSIWFEIWDGRGSGLCENLGSWILKFNKWRDIVHD